MESRGGPRETPIFGFQPRPGIVPSISHDPSCTRRQTRLDGPERALSGHEGLKAAIARALACPWQRCTVHFVRDMHQHCRRSERRLVSAALREVFDAESFDSAKERCGAVIERLRGTTPKVSELLEAAEEDLLAFYPFPEAHWSKLRSTNPLERVNREIGRRSDVVGIFANDAAVIRLVGALLIEQNDEWLVGRRYLSEESVSLILDREIEDFPSQDQEKEVAELEPA
jgi:putative transposase